MKDYRLWRGTKDIHKFKRPSKLTTREIKLIKARHSQAWNRAKSEIYFSTK
jgi:hypothetical protein